MDTSVLKFTRWGMIFALLSMDIIAPLYEAMGLNLRDNNSFRQMLRQLILENRKDYEQNPEVIPPLADRMLAELEAKFGKEEAEHLYKWATTVYNEVHVDQPQWSAWELLFFRAVYNAEIQERLGLPQHKLDSILSQYREEVNTDDVEQLSEKLKARPLSDWDLEMYSIHQFNNDDISDPFLIVLRVVRINRFQLFWEKLLDQLSHAEKEQLWNQGQSMLKSMSIWMPENDPLRQPDSLRRQL